MKKHLLYALTAVFCLLLICCGKSEDGGDSQNKIEIFFEKGENISANPRAREANIDSAYTTFSEKNNDSITRYFYRRATVAYYDLKKYDKSLRTSRKVFQMGSEAGDSLTMAKSSYFSGISHYENGHNDSAFYYYRQAENLYNKIDDRNLLGEIGLYKAYIYFDIGEYVLCESEAIKALRQLEAKKSTIEIYKCNNLIGGALFGQNNYPEAIKYFKNALAQLNNLRKEGYSNDNISNFKAYCHNNIGRVYIKQKNYPAAISIYETALSGIDTKVMEPSVYAMILNNLAYAKFKSGDYSGLPKMLFSSIKIRDSIGDGPGIVASNINLGEYFVSQRDTTQAISYLKRAYEGARNIKSNDDILTITKLLSNIDRVDGPFYAKQYIDISIKLHEAAKANKEKFARIQYETDKLEDEKDALTKKNSYITGISAIVLLFVAAIFIIYYLNSRNKELLLIQEQQKASEEIYQLMFEQQSKVETARTEEKTRIAMELHDGILNNIYAVRLNLEFINKKTDEDSVLKRKEYIKELQNVESEIRTVSHDLSRNEIFNAGKDFGTILSFMITSQKNNFDTQFNVEIDPSINWDAIDNTYKVNIYRIVQEALQNINKYSQAENALVKILKKDNNLNILVTDEGIGFNPEKTKGGIGLKNLRKRADALNGTISISSKKGKGTSIEVVFPLA